MLFFKVGEAIRDYFDLNRRVARIESPPKAASASSPSIEDQAREALARRYARERREAVLASPRRRARS
jgi:hypothetical protein